jgi:hypothetical protein
VVGSGFSQPTTCAITVANKVAKEMMNCIRELFPSLDDEEVFKEQTYE